MGMWAMYTPFPPKKSELLDRLVAPKKNTDGTSKSSLLGLNSLRFTEGTLGN